MKRRMFSMQRAIYNLSNPVSEKDSTPLELDEDEDPQPSGKVSLPLGGQALIATIIENEPPHTL